MATLKAVRFQNVRLPMNETLLGIVTLVGLLQLPKAKSPMDVTLIERIKDYFATNTLWIQFIID